MTGGNLLGNHDDDDDGDDDDDDDDDDEMVSPLFRIFKFPVVANLQFQLFSPPPLSPVREYKEGNKRNGFHKNVFFSRKIKIHLFLADTCICDQLSGLLPFSNDQKEPSNFF